MYKMHSDSVISVSHDNKTLEVCLSLEADKRLTNLCLKFRQLKPGWQWKQLQIIRDFLRKNKISLKCQYTLNINNAQERINSFLL